MNRLQKIAWFNLIVIAVSSGLAGGAVIVLVLIAGMPKALSGLGMLGFAGLMGLSPVIFRKDKSKVAFDERDILIQKRAALAGYGASYGFFVAVCMITWFVVGIKGSLPVIMLPMMVCGGLITLMLVQSVATLIQYGRGNKGEKS